MGTSHAFRRSIAQLAVGMAGSLLADEGGVLTIGAAQLRGIFVDGFEGGDTSRWSLTVPY